MRKFSPILVLLAAAAGCGKSAKVSGKVTCDGKPVRGSILFSPAGEGADNTGEAVAAPLKDDGSYELQVKTVGKHRVVVSPADIVYPAKPGEEYPCDLAPIEKTLVAGANEVIIALPPHKK